jgi:hypothetical protein
VFPLVVQPASRARLTVNANWLSVNFEMSEQALTEATQAQQPLPDVLREFFVANGRKGGLSKSPRKREAVLANLAKANAKRWPAKVKAA